MRRLTEMAEGRAVLLAEPDRDVAESLSRWLQEGGYSVVGVVEQGEDALRVTTVLRPDFVILDASLPCPENSLVTALEIRDSLMVSVVFTTPNPEGALSPGGPEGLSWEEILEKPFNRDELSAAMKIAAVRRRIGCLHRAWFEAFKHVADTLSFFIMILDADHHIRFLNRPGVVLSGCSRTALTDKDAIGTILSPSDQDGIRLQRWFDEGQEVEFIVDCLPAARRRIPVRWTCHPVQGPGDRCAGWICFGIEEREASSMGLDSRDWMLRQIEENIEHLVTLNDRIRNPLQVISALAGLVDDDIRDKILLQVELIDETVRNLDLKTLESTSVREYLRKHHQITLL